MLNEVLDGRSCHSECVVFMKDYAYKEMFLVENDHWWYRGLHDLVLHLLIRLFPQRPLKIFDAGCGTGRLISLLKETGHDVGGLDYSDEALEFCIQRGLDNVVKGDLNEWQPDINRYDLITCFDVLCHEWVRDDVAILRAMASGLKEDGLLFLNEPAFPILSRGHDQVVMIRERYTKKSFRKVLAAAGLQPVIMSYRIPLAFLALFVLRGYEKLKGVSTVRSDIAVIPPNAINRSLLRMLQFENRLIGLGFSFPFGSSLFTVAKKFCKKL